MRIVISDPKSGKSYQSELTKEQQVNVVGKKMGEVMDGGTLGAAGYQLELTGGSDSSGFPMRMDVSGPRKASLLVTEGVGFHSKRSGERRRRMLRGNTFTTDTAQVNSKVVTAGGTPLDQIFVKAEEKK